MTGWRAHLSALKARRADADSADSAERAGGAADRGAFGAIGANGNGVESATGAGGTDVVVFYRQAAEGAAAALAADDPGLAHERGEMAAAVAEPAADPWRPSTPDPLGDGLLLGTLARPPSWSRPAFPPPPGAWCSCCGRSHRCGGRWWREATDPKGWRCGRCYPPDHLRADQVMEVRT